MPSKSREIQRFKEQQWDFIGRASGAGTAPHITMLEVGAVSAIQDYLTDSAYPFLDEAGKPVAVQNADGSFVYLPGWDGP